MDIDYINSLLTEDSFTKKYGSGPENIKIVENYFSYEQCEQALEIAKRFEVRTDRKHLYPLSMSLNYSDLNNEIFKYTETLAQKMIKDISLIWNEPLTQYGESAHFKVHPTGSELNPHTDILHLEYPETDPDNNNPFYILNKEKVVIPNNFEIQSKIFPNMWSGHLACLIYLNDDYEGGEIYFPRQDISIKPKAGTLITFPGSLHYIHGVNKITSGTRYTITEWLSLDFLNGLTVDLEQLNRYRIN